MRAAVLFLSACLCAAPAPARAQQLIPELTAAECAQRGGTIHVWTSSMNVQPPRGECLIPPRGTGGGAVAAPSGPSSAQRQLQMMQGVLGVMGGVADLVRGMEESERRWVDELNDIKRQIAAESDARKRALLEEERARREREHEAARREMEAMIRERSQMANPFTAAPASGANPFAAAAAPATGGRCDAYFNTMIEDLKAVGRQCGVRSERMESLVDMIQGRATRAAGQGIIHTTADPDLFKVIPPGDARWSASGDWIEPNCRAPLLVRNQQESFMECYRVFVCGIRAATCAQNLARQSQNLPCMAASQQCLAANPVPTEMAGAPR